MPTSTYQDLYLYNQTINRQWYRPQKWYGCQNITAATTTSNYIPLEWYQPTGNATTLSAYPKVYFTDTDTGSIWQQWVTTTYNSNYVPTQVREATPQERQAREQWDQKRRAARARARILLADFLSEEQKAELETHGRFHVTGSRGRRYCIRTTGQAGNVDLLKPDGTVQATLCCHPRDYLPDGDAWLMQMIELRHDEDHFLRTANVHRGSLQGVR